MPASGLRQNRMWEIETCVIKVYHGLGMALMCAGSGWWVISNDAGRVKGVLILFLPDGVFGFSS
jgi:hypothetical protein